MSDINFVPPEMPLRHRLAIGLRWSAVVLIMVLMLGLFLGFLSEAAVNRAKGLTVALYEAEQEGRKRPEKPSFSSLAETDRASHLKEGGKLIRFELIDSFVQMGGRPAACIVRTSRTSGEFEETLYFIEDSIMTFHATRVDR